MRINDIIAVFFTSRQILTYNTQHCNGKDNIYYVLVMSEKTKIEINLETLNFTIASECHGTF